MVAKIIYWALAGVLALPCFIFEIIFLSPAPTMAPVFFLHKK